MLRLAACLEEHYPHSLANAVVLEAKRRGLNHEEYHSNVEYVVAHGISRTVEGRKVVIGSYHFVFEDEACRVPAGEAEKFAGLSDAYSHLYLAVSGVLRAVICIADPLRPDAAAPVAALHALGVRELVMMTGDNEKTAAAVAKRVGVDRYFAEVLPEDKAAFIQAQRDAGHTVLMIGDGVNDSTGAVCRGCGHRHLLRRGHRQGDRGHHHRHPGPDGPGDPAASGPGADGAHPLELPLYREL